MSKGVQWCMHRFNPKYFHSDPSYGLAASIRFREEPEEDEEEEEEEDDRGGDEDDNDGNSGYSE